MTTVGELKKKLEMPDTTPLEFWVVLGERPVRLVPIPGESVRFPDKQVAEIILVKAYQ